MTRRESIPVKVGNLFIGGNSPIAVQSMTDTPTDDIAGTFEQIRQMAQVGTELVRIAVNTKSAAQAVPHIKDLMAKNGIEIPLIGDFHFNGHLLLAGNPSCATALDKYRINPGNADLPGSKDNFRKFIELAIKNRKPVRIGVNGGSIEKSILSNLQSINAKSPTPKPSEEIFADAVVESALNSAKTAIEIGLPENNIILSAKMSNVREVISVNELLASNCKYPLHIGLTEAGSGDRGISASSIALGTLLMKGIGDTIRVSITPAPGENRTREIQICRQILQSAGIRFFAPEVISCPGCGRTSGDRHRKIADRVKKHIETKMPKWEMANPEVNKLKIAVMGCVVNGPGEASRANIGLHLPGKTESPFAYVYIDGKEVTSINGDDIAEKFLEILDNYIIGNEL